MNPLLRAVGIPKTILQESTGAWGANSNTRILIKLLSGLCVILGSCPQALLLGILTRCCVVCFTTTKSHVFACSFFGKTLLTKSVYTKRRSFLCESSKSESCANPRRVLRESFTLQRWLLMLAPRRASVLLPSRCIISWADQLSK